MHVVDLRRGCTDETRGFAVAFLLCPWDPGLRARPRCQAAACPGRSRRRHLPAQRPRSLPAHRPEQRPPRRLWRARPLGRPHSALAAGRAGRCRAGSPTAGPPRRGTCWGWTWAARWWSATFTTARPPSGAPAAGRWVRAGFGARPPVRSRHLPREPGGAERARSVPSDSDLRAPERLRGLPVGARRGRRSPSSAVPGARASPEPGRTRAAPPPEGWKESTAPDPRGTAVALTPLLRRSLPPTFPGYFPSVAYRLISLWTKPLLLVGHSWDLRRTCVYKRPLM